MRNGHSNHVPPALTGAVGAPAAMPPAHRWTLIGLSLFLLFLGLVPRELWGVDEPLVGTIIREMVVDGQWLVPHLNGELYAEKPPLYFWLSALPALLTGTLLPLWFRLPSTLAAIGCLWLTYRMGIRLFNARTGLLAASILATSLLFALSSQITRMDMPLVWLIMAILYSFVRFVQEESPAAADRWALAIYPLVGLAFLTKGPIGPVVPAFVIGSVLLWQRDWRSVARLRPIVGPLLACAVVLPWLIPAVLQEGVDYAKILILQQSVGRAISSFSHSRPFYYYLYTFPVTFLPWLLFLPGAFWWLWRQRESLGWRGPFLVSWTLGLFLFFSVMSGKLVIYLLPLFPGLALIIAAWWNSFLSAPDATGEAAGRRWLTGLTVASVAIFPIAAIVTTIGRFTPPEIPFWLPLTTAGATVLVALAVFRQLRQPVPLRLFAALLIATGLALAIARVAIIRLDDVQSPTRLGFFLREYKDDVEAMAIYKVRAGMLNFYAEHRFDQLAEPADVQRYMSRPTPALCVIDSRALLKVWTVLPPDLRVLKEERMGRLRLFVIANAAVPPPGGVTGDP
jgi:4-amino-4-deoxy-L-arabinose transferase-like glycosyltransferase